MKLWMKDATETSQLVERFTVGRDKEFDAMMAIFDVEGSMAHAAMLAEQGLISASDHEQIQQGLQFIREEVSRPGFSLPEQSEDIHSFVEWRLTERIGAAGKKIHTGRSRNDQVAVDLKLYLRHEIQQIKSETALLFDLLIQQSRVFSNHLIPGYTHFQLAMPSSGGLWLGAYAESLVDDLELLAAAYRVVNKNPLGSGAGYGSSFPLNRQSTTQKLGFQTLNWNSVYAQMSRGKTEKAVASAIGFLAATLSKLSYDCCLYLNQHFAFIRFPDELTTGSSIMPHKKNPDVFELIRARCNRIQAVPNELTLLINNLPSGYHRDLQLTKEILFPALEELKRCLQMTRLMIAHLEINAEELKDERYRYLFTVEAMNELVNNGMAYRDAYREIGNRVNAGTFSYDFRKLNHTHEGSIGHLCLEEISRAFSEVLSRFEPQPA